MNKELLTKTLAQIVNENFQAAYVLEKHQLDFCCRGKRSLQVACDEKHLAAERVALEIEQSVQRHHERSKDFDALTLTELADYIVSVHHAYVKRELPQLFTYLQKISSKHGERHVELYEILKDFIALKQELEEHMLKEELILFPRIKKMENSANNDRGASLNVKTPIGVMEDEHEHAGMLLQELRRLSNNYAPPADACTTYRLSFAALQAFEADLHQHIHLENNILFPKAIEFSRSRMVQ